jgi:hypothetical protein
VTLFDFGLTGLNFAIQAIVAFGGAGFGAVVYGDL